MYVMNVKILQLSIQLYRVYFFVDYTWSFIFFSDKLFLHFHFTYSYYSQSAGWARMI